MCGWKQESIKLKKFYIAATYSPATPQEIAEMFLDTWIYHRAPFFQGLQILRMEQKVTSWKLFHKTTLGAPFTIHVNLHEMEFSVKQILWKSQNLQNLRNLRPSKKVPYGTRIGQNTHMGQNISMHISTYTVNSLAWAKNSSWVPRWLSHKKCYVHDAW